MDKFSDLLKSRRKELGITKSQAADMLGITAMYYGRFEKDQLFPTKKNIERFYPLFKNVDKKKLIDIVNRRKT